MSENYNPDVLSCLANLSNDEVFTSPDLVNQMLDLLPSDLWSNKNATFLDPFTKSGVFLREIAKRLLVGLEEEIPDLQERIDHIFHNQVFGIAITELTSLLARRSVYCSKYPNCKYSVSRFETIDGNIRFKRMEHVWRDGKCVYCGASKKTFNRGADMESHAYEFIHTSHPERIFDMKFDVVIGNPPYQLSDGGAQASATPIYHLFIQQAKKLNPRFLSMIVPSRWMAGGKGLDDFRSEMIHDKHIRVLHDFINAGDCFQGVEIKGGVCYFLWDRDHPGLCQISTHDENGVVESERYLCDEGDDVYIRYPQLVSIKNKVAAKTNKTFDSIVSARKPYGLPGDFFKDPSKYGYPRIYENPIQGGFSILGLEKLKRVIRYIPASYPLEKKAGLDKYKLFISESYGAGVLGEPMPTPVVGKPGELCTETFLQVGPFNTQEEAKNCITYLNTKFFRVLVGVRKNTQHATQKVYQAVPLVNFDKKWTDKELYSKFELSKEEIDFIEKMTKSFDEE